MGVEIREMKLSWREGPRCGGLETCHRKKQGATEVLVVGFPNYGFSRGQWGHVFSRDACSGFWWKEKRKLTLLSLHCLLPPFADLKMKTQRG